MCAHKKSKPTMEINLFPFVSLKLLHELGHPEVDQGLVTLQRRKAEALVPQPPADLVCTV